MLSHLCQVVGVQMLDCLPSDVSRQVYVVCPQQHGRSCWPIGKVIRQRLRQGLRHAGICRLS